MDDPEKWTEFRIVIPANTLWLKRQGDTWFLIDQYEGGKTQLVTSKAEEFAALCVHTHEEEDWIYRHSLQFRWLRFWYRRKKRKEARNAGK